MLYIASRKQQDFNNMLGLLLDYRRVTLLVIFEELDFSQQTCSQGALVSYHNDTCSLIVYSCSTNSAFMHKYLVETC